MPWEYKKNEDGSLVMQDGEPVFIDDKTGDEALFSAVQAGWGTRFQQISHEAGSYRKERSALKVQLEGYTALGDLETVTELVTKANTIDLAQYTKAEEVKAKIDAATQGLTAQLKQIQKDTEAKIAALENDKSVLQETLHGEIIGKRFLGSPFFTDQNKTLMTPDIAQAAFEKYFRVENGVAVCYPDGFERNGDPKGSVMYSANDVGKPADFDEAIGRLWNAYQFKDRYTPSAGSGDGGAGRRTGAGGQGGNDLLKQAAEALKAGDVAESIRLKLLYQQQQGGGPAKQPPANQ